MYQTVDLKAFQAIVKQVEKFLVHVVKLPVNGERRKIGGRVITRKPPNERSSSFSSRTPWRRGLARERLADLPTAPSR